MWRRSESSDCMASQAVRLVNGTWVVTSGISCIEAGSGNRIVWSFHKGKCVTREVFAIRGVAAGKVDE